MSAINNIEKKKDDLRGAMGEDVFQYYYDFLYKHKVIDEAKLRSDLNGMTGKRKEL